MAHRIIVNNLIGGFASAFETVQLCLFHIYSEPKQIIVNTTLEEISSPLMIQTISFSTVKFSDFDKIILTMSNSDMLECKLLRADVIIGKSNMNTNSSDVMEAIRSLIGNHYPEAFQILFNYANNYLVCTQWGWSGLKYTFEAFVNEQSTRTVIIKNNNHLSFFFVLSYSKTPNENIRIRVYKNEAECVEDKHIGVFSIKNVGDALKNLIDTHAMNGLTMRTQMLEETVNRCVRLLS